MKLSLIPLEVVSPIFAGIVTDGPDYVVLHDRWEIGRIRYDRGSGGAGYWWWGLTWLHPRGLITHGRADTLEKAQADYKKAWQAWLDAGGDLKDLRHVNGPCQAYTPATQ